MKYEKQPLERDTGVTGAGSPPPEPPAKKDQGSLKYAIEDVISRQNNEFYQERVMTYGSWQKFLEAHKLPAKHNEEDS